MGEKMDVDIVIPWVDGNDEEWKKKRNKYVGNESTVESFLNGDDRFRDTNLLKYALRSIDKYASWVHHVYIVTDNQRPWWFKDNSKFSIVDHREFIPKNYLPTFNSNAIELNVFRISDLSEHFILFNDDMVLNAPTTKEDFFSKEGLPKDSAIYSIIPADDEFSHTILNNMVLVNKHFNKWGAFKKNFTSFVNFKYKSMLIRSMLTFPWHSITGFYNPHGAISYVKTNFKKLWDIEPDIFNATSNNKIRTSDDISDWVVRYFQLQSAAFSPRDINFCKFYLQNDFYNIIDDINKGKHKLICINDTDDSNPERDIPPITDKLEKKLTGVFSFEK